MAWFRRFHCLWWIATKQYRQCGLFSWNKKGGYCFLHCCCCRCCCCNCAESVTTYADARYGSGMCHQRNFKQQQKKVVRWNAWLYILRQWHFQPCVARCATLTYEPTGAVRDQTSPPVPQALTIQLCKTCRPNKLHSLRSCWLPI